ncbi:MAG: hypothetical protein K8F25_17060 [Fimbriimonadaceae bacterium]|nr:hypothetical protein [Alphaproteobacteria bacterium]
MVTNNRCPHVVDPQMADDHGSGSNEAARPGADGFYDQDEEDRSSSIQSCI